MNPENKNNVSYVADRNYYFSLDDARERGIEIALTPEQESKIGSKDKPSLFNVGFVSPEQIESYNCKECKSSFEESLNPRIYIRLDMMPEAMAMHFNCNRCGNLVFYSFIKSREGIPVEFIVEDETGNFKKPTIDSIEDLFQKIKQEAEEGNAQHMGSPSYVRELKILSAWCKKIGYDIDPERISNLKLVWKQKYLEKFKENLPELVDEILTTSRFGFHYVLADEEEPGFFDSPNAERVSYLFKNLPLINLPDDPELKMRILEIYYLFEEMWGDAKAEVKEKISGLEKMLASVDESLSNAAKNSAEFASRANFTFEQSNNIRNKILKEIDHESPL